MMEQTEKDWFFHELMSLRTDINHIGWIRVSDTLKVVDKFIQKQKTEKSKALSTSKVMISFDYPNGDKINVAVSEKMALKLLNLLEESK